MAKLESESSTPNVVSCFLLPFLCNIMSAAIDVESTYFNGLDDNILSSSPDDYLENPLCVPQDPIEELEWYPNFPEDRISLAALETEFNTENKLMFLDATEKPNKKTSEKSGFISGTAEDSSGKSAGRIPLSENSNQVFKSQTVVKNKQKQILCPNLVEVGSENKVKFLDAPGKQPAVREQTKTGIKNCVFVLPLSETGKSTEKSEVRKPVSKTERPSGKLAVRKPLSENQEFTSQSVVKTEPIRVLYPNFSEFMTVSKLLDAPEEKAKVEHFPIVRKTGKSSEEVQEKSSGKSPLPILTPEKFAEEPSLWKPFSENSNKLFQRQTNIQSKQTPVLYQFENLENNCNVRPRKNIRSKTRVGRPDHWLRFLIKPPKRKCSHCETEKTPLWRNGPLGPKTLCNACGVRYKSGRLLPEYRPAASPTFDAKRHSNFHKRILKKKGCKIF